MIAYGLTNSPGFQLAWFAEMFKNWTDSNDIPEDGVDRDALLTYVMLYWLTGTASSSVRYYKDGVETWGEPELTVAVPTAVAVFPLTTSSRFGVSRSSTTTSYGGRSSTAAGISRHGGTGSVDRRPARRLPRIPLRPDCDTPSSCAGRMDPSKAGASFQLDGEEARTGPLLAELVIWIE